MKGLSDVRAELVRLQSRELELLQELLDARKAIAPQKVVIDELIRTSTVPPIDRLPNELLADIPPPRTYVGKSGPRLAPLEGRDRGHP